MGGYCIQSIISLFSLQKYWEHYIMTNWLLILTSVASNRDLKCWYSWLPIGKTSKIINNRTNGRWTMISSIFSDGNYFWMITNDTVSSNEFWDFLTVLYYLIQNWKLWKLNNIMITLDNAPPHKSLKSYKKLKEIDVDVLFLPPYSPELAPVEFYFRDLKSVMKKINRNINIKFNSEKGRMKIYETLTKIGKNIVLNWWKEMIENAKQSIIGLS